MNTADAKALIGRLRPEIASGKTALLSKFKVRIAAVENLRLVGVIIGVLGAFVAAISRSIAGDFGLALAVGGALAALICGVFVGLMDRKKLEISQEASDAHDKADQAIDLAGSLADQLETTQTAVEVFDRKRRERLTAIQRMIEVLEASLITRSGDVVRTAETLLSSAIHSIRAAVEYKGATSLRSPSFRRLMPVVRRRWSVSRPNGPIPTWQKKAAEAGGWAEAIQAWLGKMRLRTLQEM
jgi:hypothetical protein